MTLFSIDAIRIHVRVAREGGGGYIVISFDFDYAHDEKPSLKSVTIFDNVHKTITTLLFPLYSPSFVFFLLSRCLIYNSFDSDSIGI